MLSAVTITDCNRLGREHTYVCLCHTINTYTHVLIFTLNRFLHAAMRTTKQRTDKNTRFLLAHCCCCLLALLIFINLLFNLFFYFFVSLLKQLFGNRNNSKSKIPTAFAYFEEERKMREPKTIIRNDASKCVCYCYPVVMGKEAKGGLTCTGHQWKFNLSIARWRGIAILLNILKLYIKIKSISFCLKSICKLSTYVTPSLRYFNINWIHVVLIQGNLTFIRIACCF